MSWELLEGDCRELMKKLGDASVDAVVTDPPYSIGFMNRSWDKSGVSYDVELWKEVLRILKPGGHLLAFGGTRTYHRLTCAIEDAGFGIKDSIHWVTGSGFPKSLAIDKAIDAAAGEKRKSDYQPNYKNMTHGKGWGGGKTTFADPPITEAAKRWQGFGTSLKPSHEAIVLARRQLEGNVAQNVLKHGTGGLNVDRCRVGMGKRPFRCATNEPGKYEGWGNLGGGRAVGETDQGRWPPNFVLSHSESCTEECAPDCPVAQMDRQSGYQKDRPARAVLEGGESGSRDKSYALSFHNYPAKTGYQTSGGASRFFPCFRYEAKASRAERDEGLGDLPLRSAGETTDRKDGTAGLDSPRAGAGRTGGRGGVGVRNTHPT